MALIKCTECGHDVSDKAEMCPNCGCPVSHIIRSICIECGKEIPNNVTSCPNCGCPVSTDKYISNSNQQNIVYVSPQKESKAIYYFLGIVGYFILSVIACAFIKPSYPSTIATDDIILNEYLCCAVSAILMICILSKSWGDRIAFSLWALLIPMVFVYPFWEVLMVGTAVLIFLIHITFIIIVVYRR